MRPLILLILALAAPLAPPCSAQSKSLFGIPITYSTPSASAIQNISQILDGYANHLRDYQIGGYDWVFPAIYTKTSRHIYQGSQGSQFRDPELVRDEMVQFFEIYARNSNRWISGQAAEPQWERAAHLSRVLDRLDRKPGATDEASRLLVAFVTIYAHIAVDLPRALVVVHERHQPKTDLGAISEDYQRTTAVFTPVLEEIVREARITPEFLARVWDDLPAWLQKLLINTNSPIGAGAFVRGIRSFAWLRFRYLMLQRAPRQEARALPGSSSLAPLDLPTSFGTTLPGAALLPASPPGPAKDRLRGLLQRLTPGRDDSLQSIDRAFSLFLDGREPFPGVTTGLE